MSRRRRSSSGFNFHAALSTPDSKVVYHCYSSHGRVYAQTPPWGSKIQVLCMNMTTREVKIVDGLFTEDGEWHCDEMRGQKDWARLGWTMADGSLPLGELDIVDPALTQVGYLRLIDVRDMKIPHSVIYPPGHQAPKV